MQIGETVGHVLPYIKLISRDTAVAGTIRKAGLQKIRDLLAAEESWIDTDEAQRQAALLADPPVDPATQIPEGATDGMTAEEAAEAFGYTLTAEQPEAIEEAPPPPPPVED